MTCGKKKSLLNLNPVIIGQHVVFSLKSDEQPVLAGDFNLWDFENGVRLEQISQDTWKTELELPLDTYMEYSFAVNGQRILDPLNPRKVNNGTGDINNYFYMPGFTPSRYAVKKPVHGIVTEHEIVDDVRLLDSHRKIYLYQPNHDEPCDLLVVYDGYDYLKRGHIVSMVDQMITIGMIRPVALALVPSTKARFVEYAGNDSTVSFVLNKVIPLACEKLNLIDIKKNPGSFCMLGASMGGMMALYTSLRAPQIFGRVICQAGAFRMYGEDFSIFDLVDREQILPIKILMDIGRYDFLYSINHRMHNLLSEKGYDVKYHEVNGGHNYTTWRNSLPHSLEFFFSKQECSDFSGEN